MNIVPSVSQISRHLLSKKEMTMRIEELEESLQDIRGLISEADYDNKNVTFDMLAGFYFEVKRLSHNTVEE